MEIVSLLIVIFLSSLLLLWRKSKTKNNNPPGPWRLPIIGSLHHLLTGLPSHITLRGLAQRYGPLMYLKLGQVPAVVISSPTLARLALKTLDPAFADRPNNASTNIIFYNHQEIAFGQYGDRWKQMRRICILELLSARMTKSFSLIRKNELSSLLSSIRTSAGSSPVNITQKMIHFANAVTCRSAFGTICKDDIDRVISMIKEVTLLSEGFDLSDLFPSFKLLHKNSRLRDAHKKVDAIMEGILNEHIKNKAAGKNRNGEFGTEDLVDVFLRIKEDDKLQFPITNHHIKAVIFDIFIAGTETSSTTIIWALTEMMRNPRVMAKAQSEVRQVFKENKSYDEQDLEKLPYLKLVINETLRLHPSIPVVPRECREKTNIDGCTILPKTRLLVNLWAIGRDPESWHDPDSFIPERFENSSVNYMGDQFQYIPFGAGRRICPGMLFGVTNVGLPLAYLLYHFDWELPYGTRPKDIDMTETQGLTAGKYKDLYLVATSLRNDEES